MRTIRMSRLPSRRISRRRRRGGMASLEVIMATAITLPPLVWFCWVGVRLCRQLYCVISTMIGSPYI